MTQDELTEMIKSNIFMQELMAELVAQKGQILQTTSECLAMIATAASRQLDARIFVQNLERMERLMENSTPSATRAEVMRIVISLVKTSGTPSGPTH